MRLWNKIVACFMAMLMPLMAVDPNQVFDQGLSLPISQKSIDTIIHFEVGDKPYYEKYLIRPEVPAWQTTSSGVTIGLGFDVGQNTKQEVRNALEGILREEDIIALQSVTGYKGKSAYYNALPKVRNTVKVSWDQAQQIFIRDTLPRFTKETANTFALKNDTLHPHSNGALVSLVFNRGGIDNTDRKKEMRWIKYNIADGHPEKVPSDIKSMKRLWSYSKLKGLHLRRDAEAKLFQEGLDAKNRTN